MTRQEPNPQIDSLLLPFLHAIDEAEAEQQLNQLVAHAAPAIKKITSHSPDPEDVFQETIQRLIKKLWDFKADPESKAIGNYLNYVSVIASRVGKEWLRTRQPQYRSLMDALRQVLKSETRFALWDCENQERLCGLAAWPDQQISFTRSQRLIQLLNHPRAFDEAILPGRDAQVLEHAELLDAVFNWVGHPIRFDELVKIVCDLKRIEDFTFIIETDDEGTPLLSDLLLDEAWRPDEAAGWGEFLKQLWAEIELLPPLQRIAYLLNFTAADGEVEIFWVYGVVTIRRIGAVLQLTDEQFDRVWPELNLNDEQRRRAESLTNYDEKFSLLWQHLPLEDLAIAKLLGTERQKVINLRKAAGERLTRRFARR